MVKKEQLKSRFSNAKLRGRLSRSKEKGFKNFSKPFNKNLFKNKGAKLNGEAKKLILIVDDDKPLVEVYRAALEIEGYEVAVQYDGEQALKWLAINEPDLIIMDCLLPRFGGLSVMEALNSKKPGGYKKPVIMVSALDREEYKLKSKELGAVAYLVKASASISEMVDIVKDNLKSGISKIATIKKVKAL